VFNAYHFGNQTLSDHKPDIWQLQVQQNVRALIKALQDDDPTVRCRASTALRAMDAVAAVSRMEAALEQEQNPEVRSHLLTAITTLKQRTEEENAMTDYSTSETERLIAELKSDDPDRIIDAARELGELGDKVAVEPLVVLFNRSNIQIQVRLAIAEALLKLESAPVEVALLAALRSPEWRIRRNSAAILGQLKAAWAVDPLAKALNDSHEMVRRTAYAALKHIGTLEAVDAINAKKAAHQAANAEKSSEDTETATLVDTKPKKESALNGSPPPNDETQRIVWPSRMRKKFVNNPTLAPTKPLDPQKAESLKNDDSDE
jgi:hypothetical protein